MYKTSSNTRLKYKGLSLWIDRILSHSIWHQLAVLLISAMAALLIAWILLAIHPVKDVYSIQHISPLLFPFYLLIDANAFHDIYVSQGISKWTLVLACFVYGLGLVIFTGMLISILTNVITRRVDSYKRGLNSYFKANHVIILGYDDIVPSIIVSVCKDNPQKYVLLVSSLSSDYLRGKICKSIASSYSNQVVYQSGHRTSPDCYENIRLESAQSIYVVGNRTLSDHDATNIECITNIKDYLKQKDRFTKGLTITCVFEDLDTYRALQTNELFWEIKDLNIKFTPYNFYTEWAKKVFVTQKYTIQEQENCYPPIAYDIYPNTNSFVHLVFAGITNFGTSFSIEAAQALHFPNFKKIQGRRTLITFIDIKADKEIPLFMTRYRHYFEVQSYYYRDCSDKGDGKRVRHASTLFSGCYADFLDVEFEFIKGDIFSHQVQELLCKWCSDSNRKLSIFLTMTDQRSNFAISMNMPDLIYERDIPIFVRQDKSSDFIISLKNSQEYMDDQKHRQRKSIEKYVLLEDGTVTCQIQSNRYSSLYPFGMIDVLFEQEDETIIRAKLINYLYDTADYTTYKFSPDVNNGDEEEIFDLADKAWNKLSIALQWSNLYCAYNIPYKLSSLRAIRGYEADDYSHDMDTISDEEVDILAPVEHNRWNVEKLLLGYRKPSPKEDSYLFPLSEASKAKRNNKLLYIHSDIRPFDELNNITELDKEIIRYTPWICRLSTIYMSTHKAPNHVYHAPLKKYPTTSTLFGVALALILALIGVGEIVKARYASSNQLERHVSEKGDTLSVVFQSNINPQTIIYNGKTYQLEKDD